MHKINGMKNIVYTSKILGNYRIQVGHYIYIYTQARSLEIIGSKWAIIYIYIYIYIYIQLYIIISIKIFDLIIHYFKSLTNRNI